MLRRLLVGTVVMTSMLGHAQGVTAGPPSASAPPVVAAEPAPGAPTPAGTNVNVNVVVGAPAGPAAPAPVAAPVEEAKYPIHLRGGLGAGLGVFVAASGPMIGATHELRIGAQLTRLFGASLAVGGTGAFALGISASTSGGSVSASAAGYNQASLLGDVLLGDKFFVALGPTIAKGGWANLSVSANTSGGGVGAQAAEGWIPGVAGKIGLVGGGDRRDAVTGRQAGLTFSLDFGVLFGKQSSAAVEANAKGGSVGVKLDEPVMAFPFMLVLGYEWR